MERTLESTVLHIARTRLTKDYPGQIAECLNALNEEQTWWRPNEKANAVGNLVVHLAGSNRYYFDYVIGGGQDTRNRDAEFAARGGKTKADVTQVWEDAVALADRTLASFDPLRLMETTARTGKETTYAQILLHVTHHNAVHVGQIVYVTKHLVPGAIDELWMKMRSR